MNKTVSTMTAYEVDEWVRAHSGRRVVRMTPKAAPPRPKGESETSCGICTHGFGSHALTLNTCRRCDCPGFLLSPAGIADYVRRSHGVWSGSGLRIVPFGLMRRMRGQR